MKNTLMRRYDEEVGDVPSQYHDLVKDILRNLEEALLLHEVNHNLLSYMAKNNSCMLKLQLTSTCGAISEVDATISLARVAVEYDFIRPKVHKSFTKSQISTFFTRFTQHALL